jgi:hypothetical protein
LPINYFCHHYENLKKEQFENERCEWILGKWKGVNLPIIHNYIPQFELASEYAFKFLKIDFENYNDLTNK